MQVSSAYQMPVSESLVFAPDPRNLPRAKLAALEH
jgi:hypothetical protein